MPDFDIFYNFADFAIDNKLAPIASDVTFELELQAESIALNLGMIVQNVRLSESETISIKAELSSTTKLKVKSQPLQVYGGKAIKHRTSL